MHFFTQQTSLFLKDLIRVGSAVVFNDVVLLLANSKSQMQQLIKQLHDIAKKNLVSPNKIFFTFLTVKYRGQEAGFKTIKPTHSIVGEIHKNSFSDYKN